MLHEGNLSIAEWFIQSSRPSLLGQDCLGTHCMTPSDVYMRAVEGGSQGSPCSDSVLDRKQKGRSVLCEKNVCVFHSKFSSLFYSRNFFSLFLLQTNPVVLPEKE